MQAQQQGNEPLRLEARGLTRTYRRGDASVAALAGVDLDVQPGASSPSLAHRAAAKRRCCTCSLASIAPTRALCGWMANC